MGLGRIAPGVALAAHRKSVGSQLLGLYGISGPPRPLERIANQAARMHALLARAASPDRAGAILRERDARRVVFGLEGDLKLYASSARGEPARKLNRAFERVKELEDLLGEAAQADTILAKAKSVGAPPWALATLSGRASRARAEADKLVAGLWALRNGKSLGLAQVLGDAAQVNWPGGATDRRTVVGWVRDLLGAVENEAKSVRRGDAGDPDALHAVRRKLRWLPIVMEGLDGLLQVGPPTGRFPREAALLGAKAERERLKIPQLPPRNRADDPIVIPGDLYAGLMRCILELGELKDVAECCEALEETFHDAGKHRRDARALLGIDDLEKHLEKRAEPLLADVAHLARELRAVL